MRSIIAIAACIMTFIVIGVVEAGDTDYRELYRQGVEFNKRGEFSKAIECYSKVIVKHQAPELYFVRGRAFKQNNEFDRAIADFSKAISLKKDYAEAYNHRGVTYIGKGDLSLAMADFRKGCDLGHADACANLKRLQQGKH